MRTKRIFGERKDYVTGKIQLGEMSVNIGLGQLSGWKEISKRLSELGALKGPSSQSSSE